MITSIILFFAVLSTLYLLKFFIEFLIKLFSPEPTIMKISTIDSIFLYLSISYIITILIRLPNV